MVDDKDNQDNTEVNLRLFGKSAQIRGIGTIIVLGMLVFGSGLGWMLYDLSHAAATAVREALVVQQQTAVEHKAIMEAAGLIKDNQEKIEEGMNKVNSSVKVQNYILLADPTEKADIKRKLSVPKELRDLGVRDR